MKTLTMISALTLGVSVVTALAQQAAPSSIPAAPAPITASPAPAADPAYVYKTLRLNRIALDALLAKPEQVLIVDVRRPDELTKIGGFPVYLSIQAKDVQKSLGFIPQNRLIVTVSNHAHRAGAVGDLLTGYGFHVVGAVGAQDYEVEGGVLTKITPPPPRTAATEAR